MEWYKLEIMNMKKSHIRKLMELYKTFEELYKEDNFKLFNEDLKRKLEKARKINLDNVCEIYKKNNIRIVSANNREYPRRLKEIVDYPLFLYVKGKKIEIKEEKRNIAIVGTRKMTKYGQSSCEKIIKELVEKYEIKIISGLAEGVDTIALKAAMDKKIDTIAVVGTGLDIVYPYENKYLWEKISEDGILISEYPLGTTGTKWNFPKRNRIIAGLADGILVIESYKKGGALITAELGFELNKEIFAIPGFINYPSFEGCNNLIKNNKAKLVTNAEDIAKEFLWDIDFTKNRKNNLNKEEKLLFNILVEEMSLEEIIEKINDKSQEKKDIKEILTILMSLKIKGIIVETGIGKYMRIV